VLKVLCQLPKLQILYYHGNAVSDFKEVDTLIRIKTLIKLTLHGNPVDQNIGVCCWTIAVVYAIICSFYSFGFIRGGGVAATPTMALAIFGKSPFTSRKGLLHTLHCKLRLKITFLSLRCMRSARKAAHDGK